MIMQRQSSTPASLKAARHYEYASYTHLADQGRYNSYQQHGDQAIGYQPDGVELCFGYIFTIQL
jgi:hypothetical protein